MIAVERINNELEAGATPAPSGYTPQLSEVEGYRDSSMTQNEAGGTGSGAGGEFRLERADDAGTFAAGGGGGGDGDGGEGGSGKGYVRKAGDGHGEHGELTTPKARELAAKVARIEGHPPAPPAARRSAREQKRETTVSGGGWGGGGKPQLGCRLRECDAVSAPFDLAKVYRNPVTMHRGKWSKGMPVKIPKFLGIEGRMTRMQRGKGSEVMHKAVKWSHLGPVSASLAGCLPGKDAARAALPKDGAFESCAVVGNG